MQITLKIALAAAAFASVSVQALAFDMPSDGTKNFSAPSYAPSYFTDESVPESARVNHEATFDSQEVLESAASEEPPAVRYGRHGTAYRYARHAQIRYSARVGMIHSPSAARTIGKAGERVSAGKIYTPKHARTGLRQHAAGDAPGDCLT